MSRLLDKLKTDILVADGAMGTLLYADGLESCHEYYNISHPERILAIHQAYIAAEQTSFRPILMVLKDIV